MTADHHALIEEARAEHWQYNGTAWCRCGFPMPCTIARLAAALEAADRERSQAWADLRVLTETLDTVGVETSRQLAAAEREVAENRTMFERQAAAVRHHTARADAVERELAAARPVVAAALQWAQSHSRTRELALSDAVMAWQHAAALAPTKEEPA